MDLALTYITSPIILLVTGLVAGVVFSQKIKDWVSGTSAEFRSAMASVEAKAKADVKAAVTDVFAKIVPPPAALNPAAPPAVTATVTTPEAQLAAAGVPKSVIDEFTAVIAKSQAEPVPPPAVEAPHA